MNSAGGRHIGCAVTKRKGNYKFIIIIITKIRQKSKEYQVLLILSIFPVSNKWNTFFFEI